ncbi:MAG: hypothetical protein V9G63_11465 [Candidatus Competibacter sp.]|nr:hypothetical protein [Candidatus Competibacteraceae bacterium]
MVELDNFYDILEIALKNHVILEKITGKIALEAAAQLLAADAFCIIEGGWIDPAQARKLKDKSEGRFYPVYCGYPTGKVKERFKMIKNGNSHWLVEESEKSACAYLRAQIKLSQWYRKQCKKHDLPFFDFSKVEDGVAALSSDYFNWRLSTTALRQAPV